MGGVCTRLIERNSSIPITQSQVFSTARNFQTSVEINVLQGERPMANQNKSLGKFKLDGIRRAIDANGIVNVSAKDLGTGKHQEITPQGSSNMSREEIDRAVREAQQYAEEDKRTKEESTAKDSLERMLYQAEEAKKQMSKEQKKEVDEALKRGKKALKSKNPQEMLDCASELERLIGNQA